MLCTKQTVSILILAGKILLSQLSVDHTLSEKNHMNTSSRLLKSKYFGCFLSL